MFGMKWTSPLVAILMAGIFLVPSTSGQVSSDQGEQQDRQEGGRRSRRERGGFGGPGGPRGPREFTAEDRERFEERMVDRYMERLTENYELDDQQQTQVREQLEQVRQQQKTFAESRSGDFDALRDQMRELWNAREQGGEFDREKARELGEKMRTLWQDAPLMNRQQIRENVEKLLPAEQVERGRSRWESEEQERDRRREEMRQRWEERRQQREAERAGQTDTEEPAEPDGSVQSDEPSGQDEAAGANDGERRRGRREGREERRRQRRQQDQEPNADQSSDQEQGQDQEVSAAEGEQPQGDRRRRRIRENPIGPWEQYVRDFVQRYDLDPSQQSTAQSVLREMQQRRTTYEQTRRGDFEAAQQLEDVGKRQQRLDELNRPVIRLFEDLKSRLERIPTAQQRQLVNGRISTSRPAFATSQPTDVSSRPAGAGEPNRGTREERRGRRGNREGNRDGGGE